MTTIINTENCLSSHVCRRWINERNCHAKDILLNLLTPPPLLSPHSKELANNYPPGDLIENSRYGEGGFIEMGELIRVFTVSTKILSTMHSVVELGLRFVSI